MVRSLLQFFTSNGRENFGTTNITHFKNWVWGLGFGLEREAHFVLNMNHWSISLSPYQQRVLPRHNWAFGPIKMGPIICGDPFFQM